MNRRATFGPVVLLGLGGATLAAVAGHKPLVRPGDGALDDAGLSAFASLVEERVESGLPLAGALALVVLALWGVLLVTRGRVRRWLALLAAVLAGSVATTSVFGYRDLDRGFGDRVTDLLGGHGGTGPVTAEPTGWLWALLAGSLLALVAGVLAVWLAPAWPEMGTRYDAPGTAAAGSETRPDGDGEPTNLDLWKRLDEGQDPTIDPSGPQA